MQGLPGECEVGLADRLALRGVHVDQLGDLGRESLPVVDELCLADQLAHPGAHHVDADDWPVLGPDHLDEALRPQDLALGVAGEVVGEGLDTVGAVSLGGLRPR